MWYQTNKYRAKKTTVDGIEFDSKKESDRYRELKLLEGAGAISALELQKRYLLIPSQKDERGKTIERACYYIADFVYLENGETVVEDTKGVKTPEYIIKRKLMLERYGIKVREV